MNLAEAIKLRLATETARLLGELADDAGISAVIDVLVALPEPGAEFCRPLCDIREVLARQFYENRIVLKAEHQVRFRAPDPRAWRWNELAGAWVDLEGKPWRPR